MMLNRSVHISKHLHTKHLLSTGSVRVLITYNAALLLRLPALEELASEGR